MKTTLEAAGIYSAQRLARKSGLSSRAFAHHLARLGLIRPITPPGIRARFDDDALRVAKVFAALQRQGRGIGPKTLLKVMASVVRDYAAKVERETIQPLNQEVEKYTRKIQDAVLDAIWSTPYREHAAIEDWEGELLSELEARKFAEETQVLRMHLATRAKALAQKPDIPPDAPVWSALDPFLGGSRQRTDFLELLYRTGVLSDLIDAAWPTKRERRE